MPPVPGRLLRLAGIATASGAFSGLFAAVQLAFAWQLAKKAGLR
jgi:hypothetical protein